MKPAKSVEKTTWLKKNMIVVGFGIGVIDVNMNGVIKKRWWF